MAKVKDKYYVVWRGIKPGIYTSWDECKKQVEGVQSALYRSFTSKTEAIMAFNGSPFDHLNKEKKNTSGYKGVHSGTSPILDSISVDAACSGNPGVLEYRGVMTRTGEEIFRRGPYPEGTTNIGEFLAIVTGLAWLKQNGLSLPLYSDSYNGLLWVRQKNVKTKLEKTPKNQELFVIVEKALNWLAQNSYENQLLKWETSKWGEIPADFGRK